MKSDLIKIKLNPDKENRLHPNKLIKAKKRVLETMESLVLDEGQNADTVWIGDCETMFDRLGEIFYLLGGTEEELREKFPDYI